MNVNLHVLGEPPPEKLVIPWLVTCLGASFLDGLAEVVPVPPGHHVAMVGGNAA